MRFLKAYSKCLDVLEKIIRVVLIVLLAAMVLISFYQCVMRYSFSRSQPWCEELTLYLGVYSVLIGIAICSRRESHLQVDFILNLYSKRVRCLMTAICTAISIVAMAAVCAYAFQLLPVATGRATTLPITMREIYIAFPIGAILMILFAIETTVRNFIGFLRGGEVVTRKEVRE